MFSVLIQMDAMDRCTSGQETKMLLSLTTLCWTEAQKTTSYATAAFAAITTTLSWTNKPFNVTVHYHIKLYISELGLGSTRVRIN